MIGKSVRDVMTRDVIAVRPETPLKDVARLLVRHGISGVPVVQTDGTLLGVVSEADFLIKERGIDGLRRRPLGRLIGESPQTRSELAKVKGLTAAAAMTAPAITITPDVSVREAAARMVERGINRLPVVTEKGTLAGIVTRVDLIRGYVVADTQLEQTIRDEVISHTMWLDPTQLDLSVVDGVVSISGTVESWSDAQILEGLITKVDGVVGVNATLDWIVDDRRIEPPREMLTPPWGPR